MTRTILSSRLTTCEADEDGTAVRLDFLDEAGEPVSVAFPFAQAQSIVMTLPGLLSQALRRQIKSESVRFVFGLGRWKVESGDTQCAIVTLATDDGFEVSYGVPLEACRSLGWALRHEAETLEGKPDEASQTPGSH